MSGLNVAATEFVFRPREPAPATLPDASGGSPVPHAEPSTVTTENYDPLWRYLEDEDIYDVGQDGDAFTRASETFTSASETFTSASETFTRASETVPGASETIPGATTVPPPPNATPTPTPRQIDEAAWIEYANSLQGSEHSGLSGDGAYTLTPFDALCLLFGEMNVGEDELEAALHDANYDLESAALKLARTERAERSDVRGGHPPKVGASPLSREGQADDVDSSASASAGAYIDQLASAGADDEHDAYTRASLNVSSGHKPVLISRETFDKYLSELPESGKTTRICRHFMEGNCLRSDCWFSHDIRGAVCKFWLRGHCLKEHCDFLHSIPNIAKADLEAQVLAERDAERSRTDASARREAAQTLDFPVLGARAAAPARGPQTAFSEAIKKHKGVDKSRFVVVTGSGPAASAEKRSGTPDLAAPPAPAALLSSRNARSSGRLMLRVPRLLPTMETGADVNRLYLAYRKVFFTLGANRNKLLARATTAYKRGNPAEARALSREAATWSDRLAVEGLACAQAMIRARQKALRDAVMESATSAALSAVRDATSDRRVRGRYLGIYGTCLGVVSAAALSASERHLSSDERTEVAVDLHGLHGTEAVRLLEEFLAELGRVYFRGLAYVIVGQSRHSNSASSAFKGLGQHCMRFLDENGYPWEFIGGILIVDPMPY